MSDIGKAFDKRVGTNSEGFRSRKKHLGEKTSRGKDSVPFQRGPVQTLRMTPTQRKWIELMFPENQKRKELICCLKSVNGKVDCTAVRYVDFAPLDEYYSGCEGSGLVTVLGNMPVIGDWGKLRGYKGDGFYRFSWKFTNRNPRNECEICVDASVPLEFVSAKELVLSIVQSVKKAGSRDLDQLNRDDETIQNELTNSDDKVFLYELLQNANDYPCPGKKVRVEIRLDKDCLCFRHTGCEFSALNVNALCSAGAGDKSDNPNAIGYKGIGFKTVFRNNSRVYLKSGEYSFWFDRERAKQEVRINAPWRRVPIWDDVNYSDMGDFRVGFKLYPDRPELLDPKNENGYCCILRRLFKDERVLLFIPELLDVSIQTSVNEKWCVSKRSSCWCVSDLPPVKLPDSVKDEIDREVKAKNIPPKLKGKERTRVTFACNINDRRLLPVEDACLYCFLPAERARWGFPFLMNTDMVPTGPRDDIRPDLKLNKQLSRIAGEEFCKWINSLLKSGKYDYDSIFALVPDFEACVDKAELPAVKDFLREFKLGFETGVADLQVPDLSGELMPISQVWYDEIGVIDGLGSAFWMKISCIERKVNKSLLDSASFKRFILCYRKKLNIRTFGWNELRAECEREIIRDWLKNPNANSAFVSFLLENAVVEKFVNAQIFLDNKGVLGRACDLYSYGDGVKNVEKHLPQFVRYARYLSPKVTYHDKLKGVKFKGFGPRTFLVENVLSQAAIKETREALKEIEVAKGFWSFIAHYRMWNGKERFADDYALLGGLPFVTETGDVCESFISDEFSVYIADDHGDPKILGYEWFKSRVRFVNHKYFEGEDGDAIKDFLTSRLFTNKKRLVGKVEVKGVLVDVFDKFKGQILADVRAAKLDMGVYEFLSDCVEQKCINEKWLEEQIVHWPVENEAGELVERNGKSAWHYNKLLIDILNNRWIKGDEFVVLSQKYLPRRSLFDIIGVKDFEKEGFGEFFRNAICRHLNKNCSDDELVAFHKYIQKQVATDQLVTKPQFDALKNTPVIVHTKDGVCRLDGCEGVLICQKPIDVPLEISEGRLPATAKVLDSRLCGTDGDEMMRYWHEKLGCQILDEEARKGKTIEAYVERQRLVFNGTSVDEEFKRRHLNFVRFIICQEVEAACLKDIKLIDSKGCLATPESLVLPEVYEPKCHFKKYGCDLNYVSECYSETPDRTRVAELLRKLGVRDEFQAQDVGCLSVESFCKYYWTEYVASHAPDDEVIKAMKDNPSILDRTGCVRKPSELYSACLEHPYLAKIGDANKLLPLCEGVNTKFYENLDFMDSLTASDAISFLLEDSDGTDYQFRGRALGWIANGNLLPADKERYRKDERAAWRNLKNGQMTHVEKLCVIKSHGANRVRAHFGNSGFVMDLRNICNGEQQIGKGDIERAFEKLGVVLVDNSTLEPLPSGEAVDGCIKNDVKVRLLILLAVSGEDNWAEEYAKKESVLDGCSFKICDSIVESCAVFAQLKSEHGKFSEKDGVAYYVGGWQDKHVFLDVVKYLKMRLGLGDQYTDEDLKEAFDTDGGDRKLVDKILSAGDRLLRDNLFMQKLGDVSHSVMQAVKDKLVQSEREKLLKVDLSNNGLPNEVESNVEQEKISSESSQGEESGADQNSNTPENNQPQEHEREKHWIGEYEVDEDEYSQLSQIFTDGDSSDDVETAKKKDENKLACLRLFNQLEAQGLEPCMDGHREIEYVVRKLYAGLGKSGPNIDINTGERLHVISAMGGVGYIPPRWWNKVVNNENGTNVICAVTGASKENCALIRSYEDLLIHVGDNAIPVKIRGANAEERVHIATNWFSSVDVPCTAGKIYALLKLRDKTVMNTAFTKGFCSDEMSKSEETHNDDL